MNKDTAFIWAEIRQMIGTYLRPVGVIIINATTDERFVAKDKFVEETRRNARSKICYIDRGFRDLFIDKIEGPVGRSKLRYNKLLKHAEDGIVILGLGGDDRVKTTLTAIYALMERQRNGERGVLLTNGRGNVFFVESAYEGLCPINIGWNRYSRGWGVFACRFGCGIPWLPGSRVFSPVNF